MAAEKPPKPKVRQQYTDNISELQDDEDTMIIGRDSFGSSDIATGIRNLANQPTKIRSPWEIYAKVIGYEDNPQKAAQIYINNFKTEPAADLRYVYKIRADLHQAHLNDPAQWPEDHLKHVLYLSLHPDAVTSPEYGGPAQLPLGSDVVCRYRNNAKREGLFIVRVEDTDANAGATSADYATISENVTNSLSGLFDGVVGAVSSVAGFLGFSEKSNFSTPKHLKMTSKQQNALGIVVRKLLCPDATKFTSKFGMRIHPKTGAKKFHGGCDFACSPAGKTGAAITTPAAGVVKRAYRDWTGNEKQVWKEKGGNQVVVDHLDGKKSYFLHLKDVKVSLNQTVGQGDTIGTMGNTGIGTNAHLHYTVKENGTAVDPIPQLLKWFGDVNALGTDQGADGDSLVERMIQAGKDPESEDVVIRNEVVHIYKANL